MSESSTKTYLKEVLGIHNWVQPQITQEHDFNDSLQEFDGPLRLEKLKQHWDLIYLNFSMNSQKSYFEGESRELFLKMKVAMKIETKSQLELEAKPEARDFVIPWIQKHFPNSILLVFTEAPRSLSDPKIFETWSPFSLIQNPDRKKEAWTTLQQVTQRLKAP